MIVLSKTTGLPKLAWLWLLDSGPQCVCHCQYFNEASLVVLIQQVTGLCTPQSVCHYSYFNEASLVVLIQHFQGQTFQDKTAATLIILRLSSLSQALSIASALIAIYSE